MLIMPPPVNDAVGPVVPGATVIGTNDAAANASARRRAATARPSARPSRIAFAISSEIAAATGRPMFRPSRSSIFC